MYPKINNSVLGPIGLLFAAGSRDLRDRRDGRRVQAHLRRADGPVQLGNKDGIQVMFHVKNGYPPQNQG